MHALRIGGIALLGLTLAATASADRLLFTPTGSKIRRDSARFELFSVPSRDQAFGWVGYGLGTWWEVELAGESLNAGNITWSGNVAYNFSQPILDTAPGISIGALDLGNDTADGRALYAAFTFWLGNEGTFNQQVPTRFTIGFWSRTTGAAFANVRLPFTEWFSLMAEHDSRRITAGFELTPVSDASFRVLWRGGDPGIGLTFRRRF